MHFEALNGGQEPAFSYSPERADGGDEALFRFLTDIYGAVPLEHPEMRADVVEEGPILDVKTGEETGYRRQVRLHFSREGKSITVLLLIHAPNRYGPFPTLLFPNIYGNHSTTPDPEVEPSDVWAIDFPRRQIPFHPRQRGRWEERFNMRAILENGCAAATFCYSDIVPDAPAHFTQAAYSLYPELMRSEDPPRAIGMQGAGMSWVADYMMQDSLVEPSAVGIMGFSRTGKAVPVTALHDARFKVGFPVGSGRTGVAPSQSSRGETRLWMAMNWPHWFSEKYNQWAERRHSLPFDQEHVIARAKFPLKAVVGMRDHWADPDGTMRVIEAANALRASRGLGAPHEYHLHHMGHVVPNWWKFFTGELKREA